MPGHDANPEQQAPANSSERLDAIMRLRFDNEGGCAKAVETRRIEIVYDKVRSSERLSRAIRERVESFGDAFASCHVTVGRRAGLPLPRLYVAVEVDAGSDSLRLAQQAPWGATIDRLVPTAHSVLDLALMMVMGAPTAEPARQS